MRGVNLAAQQIEIQAGMHLAHIGRVIAVAVMAFCKHGNAGDMGGFEGLPKRLGVKARTDAGDAAIGVEVEVDLAETHGMAHFWQE